MALEEHITTGTVDPEESPAVTFHTVPTYYRQDVSSSFWSLCHLKERHGHVTCCGQERVNEVAYVNSGQYL